MVFRLPDPEFTSSRRARSNFSLALRMAVLFVAALWLIWLADEAFGLGLQRFGLRPGRLSGLVGVLTAPLLHGSAGHLMNNSIPLLVALTATLYLYPNSAVRVIPLVWLVSGALGWLIGRPSLHFGASGLLYGLLAFVFLSGVLRRDMRSVSVSLMVAFLYGTMIWGVLPIRPNMSWELHLAGAACGLLLAWLYRGYDQVPLKRYEWESDESVPEWYPEAPDEGAEVMPEPPRKVNGPDQEQLPGRDETIR